MLIEPLREAMPMATQSAVVPERATRIIGIRQEQQDTHGAAFEKKDGDTPAMKDGDGLEKKDGDGLVKMEMGLRRRMEMSLRRRMEMSL